MTKWQDEHGIPVDDRGRHDAALIDWRELDAVPTLHQSYTANLKIETDDERVWLERTTTADGEHCDHHITVERLRAGRWETTSEN